MKCDLVDVFGSGPLKGNPLAVVHNSQALSDTEMLQLTQWLGFSETTFLIPPRDPAADYAVRIFYPGGELPFAGHPTLGTCHAWLEAGGLPREPGRIMQECGIGMVEVRGEAGRLAFKAPPFTRSGALSPDERANAVRLAGVDDASVIEAVHIANGPAWQLLRLRSAEDVISARPLAEAPAGSDIGLAGPGTPGSGVDWELRAFFTNHQGRLVEDPVTGSFNAGVALHLFGAGLAERRYVGAQGRMIGADGRVTCEQQADGVWIGGRCDTIAAGAGLRTFG